MRVRTKTLALVLLGAATLVRTESFADGRFNPVGEIVSSSGLFFDVRIPRQLVGHCVDLVHVGVPSDPEGKFKEDLNVVGEGLNKKLVYGSSVSCQMPIISREQVKAAGLYNRKYDVPVVRPPSRTGLDGAPGWLRIYDKFNSIWWRTKKESAEISAYFSAEGTVYSFSVSCFGEGCRNENVRDILRLVGETSGQVKGELTEVRLPAPVCYPGPCGGTPGGG